MEYRKDGGACVPLRVHTVVVSIQHDQYVSLGRLRTEVMEHVIRQVISSNLIDKRTIFHINQSGRFVNGGPQSDAGLTGMNKILGFSYILKWLSLGRKIIVDTYGGWGAHGGGAFSGKDCSKVDRSAAYAARWVAKSLIKGGLCRRVLVQLSYAIGIAEPLAVYVNSYGTGEMPDSELLRIVNENFDLRPGAIIK